ncbi:MAG: hypothetical protein ACRCX8_20000 [Sarcina sp.]
MNLYFHFYNDHKSEYVKVDKNTTAVKTNLEKFNLKVFELECSADLKNVTETTLVIEKENKGLYYHYKTVSGTYDAYEKSFNFNSVQMNTEDISSKFKIVLEFKESGITVFNTKENFKELYYKPNAEEYDIDVHDSKRINNVFELQNNSEDNVVFDISVNTEDVNTTLQYRYWFDNSEDSKTNVDFLPLGKSQRTFSTPINLISFVNNETFIYVEVRDVFGNIRQNKYKLLAPGNTYSLFQIFNEPIVVNSYESNIKLFIDQRNCSSIKPSITFTIDKTKKTIVSDKIFGDAFYTNNTFEFKLSELFDFTNIESVTKFKLQFILNSNATSLSNELEIILDNKKPIIKLSNLDEENYALIVDDKKTEQVNGMIFDDSLFFVGSENRKCTFDNVSNKIFIHSKMAISKIEFSSGESPYLYSYGDYYLAEDAGTDFTIKNSDNVIVDPKNYTYIRHKLKDGFKRFYIMLQKSKLSNYEKNIIEFQGGLVLKGPVSQELSAQEFLTFSDYYIVAAEVPVATKGSFSFGLGIPDFEYDFSKYVYDSNVSCRLTQMKELVMDFDSTRMIFIASKNITNVLLFNNSSKLKILKSYQADEISFFILSKGANEFFTTTDSVTFVDQYLNTLPFEKIHLVPSITDVNGSVVKIENFSMTEISNVDEKSYNFSFDIPISEGENQYTMTITDGTGLSEQVVFILEKNTKVVSVAIQEAEMTDSELFIDKNENVNLVNNKDLCFVKLIIFNETRKEKLSEKYVLVNNGSKTEKHRVLTRNGIRYVSLYLSNSIEGESYSITYDSYADELIRINTLKQDSLFLKVENNFIVGSNSYYLNFFKDEFSNVSIEYTNRQNFKCELYENYVEISRIRNTNFIEDIIITLTVNDRNGNYAHTTKTINGKFYNETVISDYYIEKAVNDGGKIDEPTYDLVIKSQDVSNVLYMTIYDEAELNVYKRKKTAYYNSETESYKFENLTSPITPKSLKVNVHLKGQEALVLEQTLFKNENIYYSKNNNKVLTTASQTTDEVIMEFNTSDATETYSSVTIFVNDEVFKESKNVLLSVGTPVVEKIKILDLPIMARIYCKYINKKGAVSYSNTYSFDFNLRATSININHNLDKKLLQTIEANSFYVGNFETKTIQLAATDSLGKTVVADLKKGNQIVHVFKPGEIYKVKLSVKDKNASRTFYQNTIQVYDAISDIIELKDTLFERVKYNKTVVIKNESLINGKELNCFLSHYVNGSLVKSYPPNVNGKNIIFKITKLSGLNKLIFNYNNEKLEISNFNFKSTVNNEQSIYDIKIDGNVIYSKEGEEYILSEASEVSMKTKGIKYFNINSQPLGRIIEKVVADNFVCRINKSWIPCTIEPLDEYKKPSNVKKITIKKMNTINFNFKLGTNKPKGVNSIKFRMGLNTPDFKTNVFKQKINTYSFVKYFSYANGYAQSIGNSEWFKLEKIERNNIIKEITCGVFKDEEIKKIIKEYLGGNYNE